ncbi:MAG: DUF4349 domain-containing protein [Gaiellaceae bacterium]
MRKVLLVLLVGALTLAAAACSSGSDDDAGDAGGGSVDGGQAVMEEEAAADVGAAESGGGEDAVAVAQESAVPSVGPRVIQTASLTLSVPMNDFQKVVDRARSYATSSGGFVVEYSASQSGDERRLVRGNLVLRVPERSYSRVMKQLSDLGRVEASEEAGQDVSQEFVDLEARERHLEAVEGQLLNLLDETNTVAEALTVQSQLNQVQLDLEQARGRLQYLEDQVAFATISLDVRERQVEAAASDDGGPWSIVDAWGTAARGFVTVVGWILIAAATIAPLVILLVLAFLGARVAYRRGIPGIKRTPSA